MQIPASKKTVVSVLRWIIEMKVPEFADMVGLSPSAVQKLESASSKLKLSEETAFRISRETGVNINWLLLGDPSKPPMTGGVFENPFPEPYTKQEFERIRANIEKGQSPHSFQPLELRPPTQELMAILESAEKQNKLDIALYKLKRFMVDLEKEFGKSGARWTLEGVRYKHLLKFEQLFSDPDQAAWDKEDGPPLSYFTREFVPTFDKEMRSHKAKWEKQLEEKKGDWMQSPGLWPLLHWVKEAVYLWPPTNPHPLIKERVEQSEANRKTLDRGLQTILPPAPDPLGRKDEEYLKRLNSEIAKVKKKRTQKKPKV